MVRTAPPGLLGPITIKGRTLRNRIVMPPMASHLSPPDGSVTQEHLDRYVPCAAAGVGLVMVEHCYVVAGGRTNDDQPGIHDDALIEGHARLCAQIQATGAVNRRAAQPRGRQGAERLQRPSAGQRLRRRGAARPGGVPRRHGRRDRGVSARLRPRRAGRLRSGRDPRRPWLPARRCFFAWISFGWRTDPSR